MRLLELKITVVDRKVAEVIKDTGTDHNHDEYTRCVIDLDRVEYAWDENELGIQLGIASGTELLS